MLIKRLKTDYIKLFGEKDTINKVENQPVNSEIKLKFMTKS